MTSTTQKLTKDDKKKLILGVIHEGFHMDVATINDDKIAELILKVCES